MHTLDWTIVALALGMVLAVAIYTQRFVHSVADFLSAGRCAGRYLLANARGESDAGLANTMSKFEIIMVSGFVLNFWEKVSVPVALLVGISGFVVYRFRETRALTLAQFLEARYSRRYRLFMGALAFVSGILNYGIFPAVSARFFIYFLGLPQHFEIGALTVSTFAAIMVGYLSCTVFMVLVGGQVTLMVTDCLEGIFSHAIYVLIVISVFWIVGWGHIVSVTSNTPPGKSMIDPFNAGDVDDFNIWFVMMAMITNLYSTMSLQNKQGFNSSARTAHESRMGGVLGNWRGYARTLMLLVLGLCAVTYLKHPDFAAAVGPIQNEIKAISDPYIQKQMTVPITLSHMLPVGIKGAFVAIMVLGLLAGDAGHMHSWGSIFVQDVMLPLRKKAMTPRQHIWALRGAVAFVACFGLFFSLVFSQTQYIALWWALTAGVFTGGAGAAVIGGLYWKRGTTTAAWAGTLTGSLLTVGGIWVTGKRWPVYRDAGRDLGLWLPEKLNGQQAAFAAVLTAVTVYIVVSLITSRGRKFDLDAMLHREPAAAAKPKRFGERFALTNILRFDANFTRADKWVAGGIFWWAMTLLCVNLVVSVWNHFQHWPTAWWSAYWMTTAIALPMVIAIVTLLWFGIGGLIDMRDFFRALRVMGRDAEDDGRVRAEKTIDATPPAEVEPIAVTSDVPVPSIAKAAGSI
ncbi:MAG: sodium:proline symporter [Phycisphaerales bacterium]|nr:sodium:proline symporter [Phycisphaerales bacterium]